MNGFFFKPDNHFSFLATDEPQADEQILEIKKQTLELQKQTLELEKLTVELKKRFEMNTKGRAKVPSAPSVTSVPSVSSVPSVPSVPSAPSAPLAPSILATEKNTASDGLKTGAGSTVLKNAEEVSKKFPKNDGKNLKGMCILEVNLDPNIKP